MLGDYLLSNPSVIALAEPDFKLIWGWHAVEEIEHKSVCFDLYQHAGGGWFKRAFVYLPVALDFFILFSILFWSMLYKDGLLKPRKLLQTIKQFLSFFFGKTGVVWYLLKHSFQYLSPSFAPWNHDNRAKTEEWIASNTENIKTL